MEKKYLIITGGSRGIGEKTILKFQQEAWHCINISRTPSPIEKVYNIKLDLTQPQQFVRLEHAWREMLTEAKEICLVHNAAYYKPDSVDTLSLLDAEKSLAINVLAPLAMNHLLIPFMPANSSIIYIGSTLAEKAVPGSASYTIAKHAVIGLMRATCQDLISQRIRTLCICPGLVDTQLLKDTMSDVLINYLLQHKIIAGRLIQPEEIANIIYFCANTPAINGAIIHANLGQVAE